MPNNGFSYPIFWKFKYGLNGKLLSFPSANISLNKPYAAWNKQIMTPDHEYKIDLELELPDSDINLNLGMFMCNIRMLSQYDQIIRSSNRFATPHYRSKLMRLIRTLVLAPLFLLSLKEEKQTLVVTLIETFTDNKNVPASRAWIEIENNKIQIYSSTLKIHAHYSGLRYLIYNWPLSAAFYGILINVLLLSSILFLSWYRFNRHVSPPTISTSKSFSTKYDKFIMKNPKSGDSPKLAHHPQVTFSEDKEIPRKSLPYDDTENFKKFDSILQSRTKAPKDFKTRPYKSLDQYLQKIYLDFQEKHKKAILNSPKHSIVSQIENLSMNQPKFDNKKEEFDSKALNEFRTKGLKLSNDFSSVDRLRRSFSHLDLLDLNLYDETTDTFENCELENLRETKRIL
ncbi:unnamed protein product [Gordionus sp. m RMFG-2023]